MFLRFANHLSRFAKYGYLEGIRTLWDTGVWGYCGVDVQTTILWAIRPFDTPDFDADARLDEARDVVRDFASVWGDRRPESFSQVASEAS